MLLGSSQGSQDDDPRGLCQEGERESQEGPGWLRNQCDDTGYATEGGITVESVDMAQPAANVSAALVVGFTANGDPRAARSLLQSLADAETARQELGAGELCNDDPQDDGQGPSWCDRQWPETEPTHE
eukprot:7734213-Pyramimonas_sp.AAC.1